MLRFEREPAWVNSITLAIFFFGWIGLTWIFDGRSKAQAEETFWQAVLFTSVMAGVGLGVSLYRHQRVSRYGQTEPTRRSESKQKCGCPRLDSVTNNTPAWTSAKQTELSTLRR